MNLKKKFQVENGGCLKGDNTSALILKGINMAVYSGEVMAVLGSKGSGKRALLDVISKRACGETHGQVLLNGVELTKKLFQTRCGYITQTLAFLPGLTVMETLSCSPSKVRISFLNSQKRSQMNIKFFLLIIITGEWQIQIIMDKENYG